MSGFLRLSGFISSLICMSGPSQIRCSKIRLSKRAEMPSKYPPSASIRGASASIKGSSHAIAAVVGSRDRLREN